MLSECEFVRLSLHRTYLTGEGERSTNYNLLTPGFIRDELGFKPDDTPNDILRLCILFVEPSSYDNEADDPINFISEDDVKVCDRYKQKGNQYFKAKEYGQAIIKYTTALNCNPLNHLIYSNRAYCHYLLGDYDEALRDIEQCVHTQPTFCKGWYRYGRILEKLDCLGKAGMAYECAFQLSGSSLRSQCLEKKNEFVLFLNQNQGIKKIQDAAQFITNFGQKPFSQEHPWSGMLQSISRRIPYLNQLQRDLVKGDEIDDARHKFNELVHDQPEWINWWRDKMFRTNVEQIMFPILSYPVLFDDQHDLLNVWLVERSAFPLIKHNKRTWGLRIRTEADTETGKRHSIHHAFILGRPTANAVIEELKKVMTFSHSHLAAVEWSNQKPMAIHFDWNMRHEFEQVRRAMSEFDIFCILKELDPTSELDADGYNYPH